ncbi:MAG: hypothetical protein M1839_007345 [Geoglossum umbratile]|nr:MAG: hypothetical protein M1839_007345 [Geoglossum umbratile]
MSNRNHHRNLEGRNFAHDHHTSHYLPLHLTQESDRQNINHSSLMREQGSSSGPGLLLQPVSQQPISQQPQPNPQGSVNLRRNAAVSSSIKRQSSHPGNSAFSNADFGPNRSSNSCQSVNSDSSLSSTQGSGRHRPKPSIDMSGIELPFEITGDEYDLPHSPRTYAYLEAIANRVFDTERNSLRAPVSMFQRSAPQHRLPASGAHSIQTMVNNSREAQHAANGNAETQSLSDHPSNLRDHRDGRQTLHPPGTLPESHQRQLRVADANKARTGAKVSDDLFAAASGRGMLNEQRPNLGIDSPTPALTVSGAPGNEAALRDLRDLRDRLNAARSEIGELRVADRGRELPLAIQRPVRSTSQNPGAFAAQDSQLSQSTGQFTLTNPISMRPHVTAVNPHQSQAPLVEQRPPIDAPWDYSRNIEEVRVLAEAWANMHMDFYEQETRTYPEVLKALLINACGPELVRPLLESKKTRSSVVVRLLFGYIVDCLANTDIFIGFDHDTDRQVANAQNTLSSPFSSTMVRKAALMDLAAVSTQIRSSIRWQEFLQSLFMKHTFELWSIVEPLLPNAVNRPKANADLSIFVRESVKLAGRMVGDAPGQEWTMLFPRVGTLFRGEEMVDRSGLVAGEPTAPHNRNLRVKLSVTPTIVRRGYVGVSIVAGMVHRANVILMG